MSKLAAAGLSRTVAVPARRAGLGKGLSGQGIGAIHGGIQRCGVFDTGQTGVAEQALECRCALADEHGRDRSVGDHVGECREVHALVPAAGDQHQRRLEGAQRRDHRVRLRALRVVDEANAIDDGDGLEAMLHTGERRRGLADGVRRHAEQEPDSDRGERVRDIVGAWDGQVGDGHDPAVGAGRGRAAAGDRETVNVGGHDPAVDDAETAGQGLLAPVA